MTDKEDTIHKAEQIISAALECRGVIYSMPKPARHHTIINAVFPPGKPLSVDPIYQGFLTNKGRFVDRFDAMKIAKNSVLGFAEKIGDRTDLFSEDLW